MRLVLERVDHVEAGRPEEDRGAEEHRAATANEPRTAIQAPTGAIPRQRPSTRCEADVNRFVYE